ncbi:hypothetical protein [Actinomadura sp. 3N508]|uniref:hypothetical protein n=1 Tax=Actinomadura sp. 3N508 TaxID=3375153 RepID=UPI0037AE87C3
MSPDTTPTHTCPVCWNQFTVNPRSAHKHTYCSGRCRSEAGRRRDKNKTITPAAPAPATPEPRPEPAAVRQCPHCGSAITIVALLTTPQVARPTTPLVANDAVIPLHRT